MMGVRRFVRLLQAVAVVCGLGLLLAGSALAAPSATTGQPQNVSQSAATLTGTVDATGALLVSGCQFDYGTDPATLSQQASCTPTPTTTGGPTQVSAQVSGLTAGTTYYYDVVLTTDAVVKSTGSTVSFSTEAANAPIVAQAQPSGVFANEATLNGTVNPQGLTVTSCQFLVASSLSGLASSPAKAPCSPTPSGSNAVPVSANLYGLTANSTYYYELSATTSAGTGTVGPYSFSTTSTPEPVPDVTTAPATGIGQTTATLNGTINPKGAPLSDCHFALGTSSSQLASSPTLIPCNTIPSGTATSPVSASLSGLAPSTTYYYELVAADNAGTSTGPSQSFQTATPPPPPTPTATTGSADKLTSNSAELTGSVNPAGQTLTGCEFLWGTTTGYGSATPCSAIPSGSASTPVSAELSGLTPGTTYYYELVVSTADGQVTGTGQSFSTYGPPTGQTGSAFGLTASSATVGALVNVHGAPVLGCGFQYGLSPMAFGSGYSGSFGAIAACRPTPSGNANEPVFASLTGLRPHTTYYYRLVVVTVGGSLTGQIGSFTTFSGQPSTGKPGVRITSSKVNRHKRTARFSWRATGASATKGQCALARVRRGHVGSHSFSGCRSPKQYSHLKRGTYEFFVRAGNAAGWGKPASHRFTI